jgi:phage shock protein E
MKTKHLLVFSFLTALPLQAEPVRDPAPPKLLFESLDRAAAPQVLTNPAIDYNAFAKLTQELQPIREKHRVSEEEFLKMAAEPGTVIFDARTTDKFQRIHVKGAVHLPFTDFTDEALRKVIPDKTTRILIYCNNNFVNEPLNFASKLVEVALNIQTFINLHAYGYTNVYELGPLLDVKGTKIPFEGTSVVKR